MLVYKAGNDNLVAARHARSTQQCSNVEPPPSATLLLTSSCTVYALCLSKGPSDLLHIRPPLLAVTLQLPDSIETFSDGLVSPQ